MIQVFYCTNTHEFTNIRLVQPTRTNMCIYYPIVYSRSNCLFFFCYVMSHWTIDQAIFSTIDWHYTIAWFAASLLKHTCATTMRVRFVYERGRYATMVKWGMVWQLLNSNNSVVYGQKHKVWVLVFLVKTSGTFWDQNWADLYFVFLFCNQTTRL